MYQFDQFGNPVIVQQFVSIPPITKIYEEGIRRQEIAKAIALEEQARNDAAKMAVLHNTISPFMQGAYNRLIEAAARGKDTVTICTFQCHLKNGSHMNDRVVIDVPGCFRDQVENIKSVIVQQVKSLILPDGIRFVLKEDWDTPSGDPWAGDFELEEHSCDLVLYITLKPSHRQKPEVDRAPSREDKVKKRLAFSPQ